MPSISSLLKSAEARRQAILNTQDDLVAYDYRNSAKTYDDFANYSKYISDRMGATPDISKKLTLQNTLNSARSGYISNEIQRQNIAIAEGSGTSTDKYNKMFNLYQMAANEGQYDLAQGLRLQLDNLSISIQNENTARQASAQSLANQMAKLQVASVEDAVNKVVGKAEYDADGNLTSGFLAGLGEQYKKLGSDKKFKQEYTPYAKELASGLNGNDPALAQVKKNLESGNFSFFDIYTGLASSVATTYRDAANVATDPDNRKKFNDAYNKYTQDEAFKLPGPSGKNFSVSLEDLQKQIKAAVVGEAYIKPVETAHGTAFEFNKERGFVWGRNADGGYELIPTYGQSPKYTSKVEKRGGSPELNAVTGEKQSERYSYDDLLNSNFFQNVRRENGYLTVTNSGEFNDVGIPVGGDVQLYVDPDGNLQVVNTTGDKAYNLNFDDKTGKFLGLKNVEANPISLFNDRFQNDFTRTLDMSKYAGNAIGDIDNKFINPGGQLGATLTGNKVSSLIQNAAFTQKAATPQIIQPAQFAPQRPLSPSQLLNAPANAKIVQAVPPPAPKIIIAPPPKPATVTVAKPGTTGSVKVSTAKPTGSILGVGGKVLAK